MLQAEPFSEVSVADRRPAPTRAHPADTSDPAAPPWRARRTSSRRDVKVGRAGTLARSRSAYRDAFPRERVSTKERLAGVA
jgi:hypothetical protein